MGRAGAQSLDATGAVVTASRVAVRYGPAASPRPSGADLTLRPGETVLLLGPSGCGKSTLALTLNGLVPQSVPAALDGTVTVDGLDTRNHHPAELAETVGVVFQDPEAQMVAATVEDEVAFGLENLRVPPSEMPSRIGAALDVVGLTRRRHDAVDELSGGGKQRLALACALAMRPRVLVLDEPTANLDPAGRADLVAVLERLPEHQAVLLIEHNLDEVGHLVDRAVALDASGRVLAEGPPHDVFDRDLERLTAAGIWVPESVRVTAALRDAGRALRRVAITPDEAAGAVREALPETKTQAGTARCPGHTGTGEAGTGERDSTGSAENTASPALEARGLSAVLDGRTVLDGIDLVVPRGDFLAIAGANGAGKTTLARMFMGLRPPSQGCALIGGADVRSIAPLDRTHRAGYVFQNPEHQFVTDSVAEELSFGLAMRGLPRDEITRRVDAALERFGLAGLEDANPFTLSHGQKRRLSVATMLVAGQDTLILDEPTFGQDARSAGELMGLLEELHAVGHTIVIITHDMGVIARHARTVAVLEAGRLTFHGPPERLFGRPELLERARLGLPPVARIGAGLGRCGRWAWCATAEELVGQLLTAHGDQRDSRNSREGAGGTR